MINRNFTKVRFVILLSLVLMPTTIYSDTPTFNCKAKDLHQVEALICNDAELVALDKELYRVYKEALVIDKKTVNGILVAEQRGWVSGKNECWKEDDIKACTMNAYNRRISELQAKYRLVQPVQTVSYGCNNNPANEIIVNYFSTKIKIAIVEYGDSAFVLFDDSNNLGKHYTGRNETLTIKENMVEFVPAYEAPVLSCELRK